jgi:subtilisin family serine protease
VRRALLAVVLAALASPAAALAGRYAVGVSEPASLEDVAAQVEGLTGDAVETDTALRAVFVDAGSARGLAAVPGVAYVERLDTPRRLAFTPNDPFLYRQWYIFQTRAFEFWPQPPALPGVRVAVIDSGIDAKHPELARRIAYGKSFVGGSWKEDKQGHGTFVAGEIAAATGNGQGIAGIAFPAQLLVAKVLRSDRTIPLEAEAKAIRWAVDNGARVINLSLSGLRDPLNRKRDTFSPLEASAVAYAYESGAVVVAAVGNGDQAPHMPWEYAGWPSALPHVLGVSAFDRDGSVPTFSNRDEFYNDVAAPGEDILSTLPRALTAQRPSCPNQGYSDCGPFEYRKADGTSFAAAQVSAAAALLLSVRPALRPDQVTNRITRNATDSTPSNGCKGCAPGRDALTGWGRLSISEALSTAVWSPLPDADRFETNDDAGGRAWKLWGSASKRSFTATLDFWDDQIDVYSIKLQRGQKLSATLRGPQGTDANLLLWRPGTRQVEDPAAQRMRVAQSARTGSAEAISGYRARTAGWYYVEVKLSRPGDGSYELSLSRR